MGEWWGDKVLSLTHRIVEEMQEEVLVPCEPRSEYVVSEKVLVAELWNNASPVVAKTGGSPNVPPELFIH